MKKLFILTVVFIFIFWFLRLVNLNSLPIFTDEAIYVRWTQIANRDPDWRFISLTDGKQPLFIWVNILSQRLISEPLLAGRWVSIIASLFSLIGFYFLGKEIFNKKIGLLTALVWAIFPFAFWHERLAMMDALLSMFCVWSLYLQVKLAKNLKVFWALFLGFVLGGGLLTKSSALFFIILSPLSFIFLKKKSVKKILLWVGLLGLSALIAEVINNIQRLSPFFYIVGQKNLTFIYSLAELGEFTLSQNWHRFWGNLSGLSGWLGVYLTPGFILMIVWAMTGQKDLLKKVFLFLWFVIPFMGLVVFGKVLYPRFILFMTVPLIILVAYGIDKAIFLLKNKILIAGFLLILFSYPIFFDLKIVFDLLSAPLPTVDRGQYLDNWPAGWGINQVVDFLQEKAKSGQIAVGTEGTFGLTPYALEIYLVDNKNIQIQGFWPVNQGWMWLEQNAQIKPTYILFKDTQIPDSSWDLEPILKIKRGKGDNYLTLYQFKTKNGQEY